MHHSEAAGPKHNLGRGTKRALVLAALVLIVVPFLLRLQLLEIRGFNPDELQHIHFGWSVSKGMVPYRDYFDHHTPWLHFFLSSLFRFYDVATVPDDAVEFLFMSRRWMWLATGVICGLTYWLGSAWRNRVTGLLAALLLSNTAFFLSKSLEVRPDVPAAAMLVGAILSTIVAVRRTGASVRAAMYRFFLGGLLLGAATMFTQKILFVGPGFAAAMLWFVIDSRLPGSRRSRFRLMVAGLVGTILPIASTLTYFAARGALWRFIDCNLVVNTRIPGPDALPFLIELVRQDPVLVFFGIAGLGLFARFSFRRDGLARGEPVLALSLLSLVAALAVHPVVTYHYFLLPLPFLALYAAAAFVCLFEILLQRLSIPERSSWTRVSKLALPVLLLTAISIHPMVRFGQTFSRGNWLTLQGIRYVITNSAPWETTLDGFTGLGVFRPQTFYYPFLHYQAMAIQTEEEQREVLEALLSGRALPKFVFWNHYLRDGVLPEVGRFLQEHYVPTGLEPILVRPFDNRLGWWNDEAPRYLGWVGGQEQAPHVLFGEGWRDPGVEFGAPVRRTRTRTSKLIVPIRHPRDFRVTVRAMADKDVVPFTAELVVNGHSGGHVEAAPRWQDYEFDVKMAYLRPGFNEFEIRFSAENDTPDRRLELAINYIELTRK